MLLDVFFESRVGPQYGYEVTGYATVLFMLNVKIAIYAYNIQINFGSSFLLPPKVLVTALMKNKTPVNRAVVIMHLVAT